MAMRRILLGVAAGMAALSGWAGAGDGALGFTMPDTTLGEGMRGGKPEQFDGMPRLLDKEKENAAERVFEKEKRERQKTYGWHGGSTRVIKPKTGRPARGPTEIARRLDGIERVLRVIPADDISSAWVVAGPRRIPLATGMALQWLPLAGDMALRHARELSKPPPPPPVLVTEP